MTTPFDPEPLTLAELDLAAPAPADPEEVLALGSEHWMGAPGTARNALWVLALTSGPCLLIWWQGVRDIDAQERGPETRDNLVHVYLTEYGLDLPAAFLRAAEYRGPRTELMHQRATALYTAARAALAALAGDDDTRIETAHAQLTDALDTPKEN